MVEAEKPLPNLVKASPFGEPFVPKHVNEEDKLRNPIEYAGQKCEIAFLQLENTYFGITDSVHLNENFFQIPHKKENNNISNRKGAYLP